jgi:uncharacterized protein YdiU (UPF0061 family)
MSAADPSRPARLSLDELRFDNRFTADLPADPNAENERRQVQGAAFSRVAARRASAPTLLAVSREMLEELDLDPDAAPKDPRFAQVFVGNEVLPGMDPHAANYGGHQFGHWAGQLGDGRALNLGEVVTRAGTRWALQLKGAGETPYSRRGDGLAVLRSSVREFLCSEAMHHLGVPTTRALSLITTGDDVLRDMFYDGRPEWEPGAVVCRVAPSFLRFGSYEIFASRGEVDLLRALLDHTIRVHFPHLGEPSTDAYVALYREVIERTADLVVHWQRVGFVHGVMNTDNLSIHGLTIDYGPYGWLEDYNPGWTPNTTDAGQKRYAFGNQPRIAQWNLAMLGNALLPAIGDSAPLQEAIDAFAPRFENGWRDMMAAKLGVPGDDPVDRELTESLVALLPKVETDMTIFFRALGNLAVTAADPGRSDEDLLAGVRDAWYRPDQVSDDVRAETLAWLRRYEARVRESGTPDEERRASMHAVNPKYVLRNYLAQLAIDAADEGDPAEIHELLDVMRRPYDEQPERERYAAKRPDWARTRPGCSALSCSS